MSEAVSIDGSGRIVLPKKIREKARIGVNVKLVVRVSGVGRVELLDPQVLFAQAQEIGAKKLNGCKEEKHQVSASLLRSIRAGQK